MRKRTEKPKDAKASGQVAGRSAGGRKKKSIDGGDWAMESRFSKPTIKKSSLRVAAAREAAEARAYKGKPAVGRPEGLAKSFDKPWAERGTRSTDSGRDERRSFDQSGRDKPYRSFEKKEGGKPFRPQREDQAGGARTGYGAPKRFGKPVFDKGRNEDRRAGFGKPEHRGEGASDFKKPYSKPWERDSEGKKPFQKNFRDRGEQPAASLGSRSEGKVSGEERRVGRLEAAPKYNLSRYDDKKPTKKSKGAEESDTLRLNRFIANAGICSRREADELIASGQISVNGKTITEMGFQVKRTDQVKFGKKALNPEKMVYILINKPKDYITTTDDPEERKTVLDLIQGACDERVYPVGRLDRNTTGLLLLTNDGELAEKLTHPSSGIKKIYQAELDKPITTEDFELLKHGLELEDGFIRPDEVGLVTPDAMVVGLEIHSGRNRIVRRMFEHLGYEVQKLDRTVFAGLNKKELPRGKWRFLLEREVIKLKYML
ncbi:pseudouridine synthase [Dyadobacter tibetensis]|uniref:pseudouridine synthase n=1 Tax=Dyadobacter tibetensis TaxID=1211851 RepID=UPI00046FAD0A|nr:pseudouridine synthase [Dyadobacter tibetensis]